MNGLLIGRFQPFHLGHLEALQFASSKVDKLWVGLGSSNKPVDKDNPFTAEQRKEIRRRPHLRIEGFQSRRTGSPPYLLLRKGRRNCEAGREVRG